MFFISSDQINAQIPTKLKPNRLYKIIVSANGGLTLPDTLAITDVQPGVAAFDNGRLIAEHPDYSLVTPDKTAAPDETMTIYLGGLGTTDPTVAAGAAAPGSTGLARVVNVPDVLVNGVKTTTLFAGLVPGAVGLYQINFVVPSDTPTGSARVTLTQNRIEGNATTLPVKR